MIEIIPFQPAHVLSIDVQSAQEHERAQFKADNLQLLAERMSFTVLVDGQIKACFGWVELFPTRALLWAVLAKDSGRWMVPFTRIAKRLVDTLPHRRIEAEVEAGFEEGGRWMEIIGLQRETQVPLRAYNAHGKDVHIYSKVR